MSKAINKDNASELQKKSVESRVRNYAIRYQNIRQIYMAGGIEGVMRTYSIKREHANRLIKKLVQ